jgi:2-amino-4-hydroxy-6-hydroxymethyldihydropteridine diphosphokinase
MHADLPLRLIAVGSNLDPHLHVPAALDLLLAEAGQLWASRVVSTAPVGLVDGGPPFYNLAIAVPGEAPLDAKAWLRPLEARLGRTRERPDANRSRTIDLDYVATLTADGLDRALPEEPYARPTVVELLRALGHGRGLHDPRLSEPGVALVLRGQPLGETPTVHRLVR